MCCSLRERRRRKTTVANGVSCCASTSTHTSVRPLVSNLGCVGGPWTREIGCRLPIAVRLNQNCISSKTVFEQPQTRCGSCPITMAALYEHTRALKWRKSPVQHIHRFEPSHEYVISNSQTDLPTDDLQRVSLVSTLPVPSRSQSPGWASLNRDRRRAPGGAFVSLFPGWSELPWLRFLAPATAFTMGFKKSHHTQPAGQRIRGAVTKVMLVEAQPIPGRVRKVLLHLGLQDAGG